MHASNAPASRGGVVLGQTEGASQICANTASSLHAAARRGSLATVSGHDHFPTTQQTWILDRLAEGVIAAPGLREALMEPVKKVVQAIKSVLENTPPELSSDLVDSGVTLCGGGALLRGLPEMVQRETDLDVRVAERPLECVARGTGIFLENLELYSQFLEGGEDLG